LDKYPAAPLRVYAVWVPLPVSMTHDAWDAANLTDDRVKAVLGYRPCHGALVCQPGGWS